MAARCGGERRAGRRGGGQWVASEGLQPLPGPPGVRYGRRQEALGGHREIARAEYRYRRRPGDRGVHCGVDGVVRAEHRRRHGATRGDRHNRRARCGPATRGEYTEPRVASLTNQAGTSSFGSELNLRTATKVFISSGAQPTWPKPFIVADADDPTIMRCSAVTFVAPVASVVFQVAPESVLSWAVPLYE